jgi:hypothetical protein
MVKSITNEFLAMTYPDEYYKNVIEPAKTGKGPVPSKMQMLSKAQPFKAVSLPFREMMNPGSVGAFRSSGTPMASRAVGLGRMALGGPFGIAALAGQGIGMGVDAIARATNTPEEYEAMKEAAKAQGGFGYFDDVDISQDAATTTPGSVVDVDAVQAAIDRARSNQATNIGIAPGIFDIDQVGDPALNPGSVNAMGIDPFGVNEDLIDRGNPLGDSRVVSEEMGLVGGIPDRNRGMPGAPTGAFEMIGGTPVAVGDVLGRQQALEKADFYEEPSKKGIGSFFGKLLGPALTLAGFPTPGKLVSAYNTVKSLQGGALGNAVSRARTGLGSLATKMRGGYGSQAAYEQARTERQQQNRTNRMIDRISKGKKTRSNPRDAGTTKAQKDAISAAIQDSYRGGGGGGSSGGGKIVCTMMNERYGFGSFRNKIWMKFHEHHGPEYQKGYHAIFLPLVKIAKGEGKINTAVRKVLEHMGRHVTADMFKIMKGKKRDTLGRIYRAIFEPACHIIGKIKSALGRG